MPLKPASPLALAALLGLLSHGVALNVDEIPVHLRAHAADPVFDCQVRQMAYEWPSISTFQSALASGDSANRLSCKHGQNCSDRNSLKFSDLIPEPFTHV